MRISKKFQTPPGFATGLGRSEVVTGDWQGTCMNIRCVWQINARSWSRERSYRESKIGEAGVCK
jgi:hypothetical protein